MRKSIAPARVSQRPSRYPGRLVSRSSERSPSPAPVKRLDLRFHQALGGEANHLVQDVGVGTLPNQILTNDPVIGHHSLRHG
jgi:hypothetical protein